MNIRLSLKLVLFLCFSETTRMRVDQYNENAFKKSDLLISLFTNMDSINAVFNSDYDKHLKIANIPYKIDYAEYVTRFQVVNVITGDTIVNTKDTSNLLYGRDIPEQQRIKFNTHRWVSESLSVESDKNQILNKDQHLSVVVESVSVFNIPDFKSIVFNSMLGFLILSILAIGMVVFLFVYALLLLFKHKKIATIKTDFVNNIKHELNTPLATLQVATNTLKKDDVQTNPDLLKNTVDIIDRQNKRLQHLVRQVVDKSVEAETLSLQKEAIDANTLFKTIISDYKMTVLNPVINTHWATILATINVDRYHFSRVVFNLLDNALKYGSTQIMIKSKVDSNDYILEITDNGMGIPTANLKQVFSKFYRVKTGNTHNTKGLGLGLYYAKQIIEAHSGNITLKNNRDKGITIIIKLPTFN